MTARRKATLTDTRQDEPNEQLDIFGCSTVEQHVVVTEPLQPLSSLFVQVFLVPTLCIVTLGEFYPGTTKCKTCGKRTKRKIPRFVYGGVQYPSRSPDSID